MAQKISITLETDTLKFLDSKTKNRSQFINKLLEKLHKEEKLEELRQAYINQAKDPEETTEIELWDFTVGDGLTADD